MIILYLNLLFILVIRAGEGPIALSDIVLYFSLEKLFISLKKLDAEFNTLFSFVPLKTITQILTNGG